MLFLRVTKYYSTSSIYNSLLNPNKLCSTFRFSVMLTPIKIPYNLFSPMQDEKYLLFLKSRTLPCILLLASISWSIQFPLPGLPGFSVFTLWPVTHDFSHRAATASSLLKCFPHHQTRTLSLSPENPPQFPTHTTLTDDQVCLPAVVAESCLTLVTPWTVTHQAPLSQDSPGKNTGVGCHFLLQGTFPTQGLNLHCRQSLYGLRRQGSK